MLIDEFDERHAGEQPWVMRAFLALCVIATGVAILRPEWGDRLSGLAPREHAWQPWTAPFLHGWPEVPRWLHLVVNVFLMVRIGPYAERLLGSVRFLGLCVVSLGAGAAAIHFTDGTNGAAVVMWSWCAPLLVALVVARRLDPSAPEGPVYKDIRWVLMLFLVLVPLLMTAIPFAYGYRGNPFPVFLDGNRYHGIALAVGLVYVGLQAGWLGRRLQS